MVQYRTGKGDFIKVYNKLVRDKIPDIIKSIWSTYEVSIVKGKENQKFLEKKLIEERKEQIKDKNLEELVDIMEFLFGLEHELGYKEEDLLNKRNEKL